MLILVHLIQQSLQIFSTAAGRRERNQKETNFNPHMLMEYHLNEKKIRKLQSVGRSPSVSV